MNAKEKRKLLADITTNMEEIDLSVDHITDFLKRIVGDNVTSDIGEIVFAWNPKQDTKIASMLPLVRATGPPPEDPEDDMPPVEVVGMQMSFYDPAQPEEIYVSSISLDNTMIIRVLEKIKTDLLLRQKELDKELTDLMKQKKGAQ